MLDYIRIILEVWRAAFWRGAEYTDPSQSINRGEKRK